MKSVVPGLALALLVLAGLGRLTATGAWSVDTDVPAALGEVSVATVNGLEYLAGGSSASGAVNTLYAFDPATRTWQARAPFPGAGRDHMGLVASGGYLYLAGGLSGLPGPSVTTFQRYDPTTNSWTTLAPMPRARAGFGIAAINGRIYVAGGIVAHDDVAPLGDFTVYDPATDTWQALAPLPTPRDHLVAVELNGRFYAIAGRAGTNAICSPYRVVDVFDPNTGAWSGAPPLATARAGHAASVANGRIQVFGGDGNSANCGPTSSVEEFSPASNSWGALAPMPVPRYAIGAASIGGFVYIPGGKIDGGTRVATHDRFDPTAATPTPGGLPAPWRSQDVGTVGVAGSASASNGTFTVNGAGGDIWATADAFHFAWQPLAGEISITARVASLQNTNPYAKAGVMLRESLAANASHVILDVTPGGSIEFMSRPATGGATTFIAGASSSAPVWLRLTRAGTTVTGAISANGSTWTEVGRTTLAVPTTLYAGMAVTSHTTAALMTATFDNVAVAGQPGNVPPTVELSTPTNGAVYAVGSAIGLTASAADTDGTISKVEYFDGTASLGVGTVPPFDVTWSGGTAGSHAIKAIATDNSGNSAASATSTISLVAASTAGLPAPFASRDVGSTGKAGTASYAAGTFTVKGAGGDIWDDTDAFQYVFRSLAGDGQIVARVGSLQNTHAYAKAGLMVRASLGASDVHALLDIRPSGDIEFLTRRAPGAATDVYGSGKAAFPAWLRITRTGNTLTAENSVNGTAWSFVGTVVLKMPSTVYVGLVVCSHDPSVLATSTFTDVSVTTTAPPPPSTITFNTRTLALAGSTTGSGYGISGFYGPTSLQLGPDGRLYVATVSGKLYVLTLDASKLADLTQVAVTAVQEIDDVFLKPSRTCNVNGDPDACTAPGGVGRQVTGIAVTPTGVPNQVALYVSNSAPSRTATADPSIDTRSGTITRLLLEPNLSTPAPDDLAVTSKQDLVVGLPRSREAHTINGLAPGADGWLYLAVGGHTNAGQPSEFFANTPEYYLSAGVVRLNLSALASRPLPIDVTNVTSPGAALALAGVFELYATGYRNGYDLAWHSNGRLYLNDNAANFSEGNTPSAADGCTTPSISPGNRPDDLNLVSQGAYGGHPNPSRHECVFDDGAVYSPPIAPETSYVPPLLGYSNGSSTNGLAEYTASTFGGAMKGNLVSATFAGNQNVRRVVLDASGTGVVREENLGQFAQPLDVATDPSGNLYVAEYGANRITVMVPGQLTSCPVPGGDPSTTDSDGDGFTDADEQANGTDPCSPANKPPDFDGDRVSDLNDADDDNDGIPDVTDQLFLDAQNGAATALPLGFEYDPTSPPGGHVANSGFTGVQIASSGARFDGTLIKAGDAGGHISLTTTAGTAAGPANSQVNALQVGFDSSAAFHVWSEMVQPFTTTAPAAGHVGGAFFGPDQDNFFRLAIVGASGGRSFVQAAIEQAGVLTVVGSFETTGAPVSYVDLHIVGDAVAHTLNAYAELNRNGTLITVAASVAAPPAWFSNNAGAARNRSLAGIVTSHGAASVTGFGYDYFRIDRTIPVPPPPPAPPAAPSSPTPSSGATSVSTATALDWSASAGATTYDLSLGTTNPPPLVASGLTATTYRPASALASGTTYFWRVVARNSTGGTAGPVWSFTTAAAPPPPPPPSTTLRRLRVLTWHVNGGRDRQGAANVDAQVSLLARSGAHVIVLQGVTASTAGDLFVQFPQKLTAATGQSWNAVAVEDPRPSSSAIEGNLLLTTLPLASSATTTFDAQPSSPAALDTKRSAARATVIVNNVAVTVVTTQLAVDGSARGLQLDSLQAWLGTVAAPRLVGGAFNMLPGDATYADMSGTYSDVWPALVRSTDQGTTTRQFGPGAQPARVDDWWQETTDTRARATEIWVIKTARSSHHPVVADVQVQ
ncbi:MAG TPA: kelch repeat-containing protein [Vicinamibacterales bacterium]|nr:kelch repeat-containing protein [Vicinamibacterales bacterium]